MSESLVALGKNFPQDIKDELLNSPSLIEADEQDRMIPFFFFNVKIKNPQEKWYPPNLFFHSLREHEDVREEINCVFLYLKKTHLYRIYVEGEGSKTVCSSQDRVFGLKRENGEQVICSECEYAPFPSHWVNGSPPPCRLVYNFIGFDMSTKEPFVIQAKGTSATPAKRFLNKYFLRKFEGHDLPLFVYKTRLSLEQPTGTYAVLRFEVIGENSPEEILSFASLTKTLVSSSKVSYDQEPPEEAPF